MKNKKTYYLLVLDRSGSMEDCLDATISGFNEQIQMIRDIQERNTDQEMRVSLSVFNHEVHHQTERCTPREVKELTKYSYIPDGSTALLDAIGMGVTRLNNAIEEEIRNDEATAVVVVLTDGYENASRNFKWEEIASLIAGLEATTSWTFSFLGTTRDAMEVAAKMNIKARNSMQFEKSKMGIVLNVVSNSMSRYMEEKSQGNKPQDFLEK